MGLLTKSLAGFGLAMTGMMAALPAAQAVETTITHASSLVGDIQYPADATHLDFVNPNAPKGGELRQGALRTFDTFNPFTIKGNAAAGIGLIYETLMSGHAGESASTEYGLLAEKLEYANDRSFVIFHMDPRAKWHDGKPVTAGDVAFTFNTLLEKGAPFYKQYYADVTQVEVLDDRRIKFHLGDPENRELVHILGGLPVLAEHYWKDRDFEATTLEPPLGSGPYKIASFEPGRNVKYERVADYWGKDHFLNKGRYNFDVMSYDYYRDIDVALEAFKAGEFDLRLENSAKRWATGYKVPALERGDIIQEKIEDKGGQPMQGWIFNQRRPQFQDRRVREALQYMFDFEWSNKTLMYNTYNRTASYFQNMELAATALPDDLELEYLEPLREQIPAEVFTSVYAPPATDGSGRDRKGLRKAKQLLTDAGWSVKDGKLVNGNGSVFEMEFLAFSPTAEQLVLPIIERLKRLGIQGNLRIVDTAQYINRLNSFDFDVITQVVAQSESPGNEQRDFWSSSAADQEGSRNRIGIKDPAVDKLIEDIITAPDRDHLVAATRALDRVLQWNYYTVPQFHLAAWRVAYWNKFGHPATSPGYNPDFASWWYDADKAATIRQ